MHLITRLMVLAVLMASAPQAFALSCLKDATPIHQEYNGQQYIVGWSGQGVHNEPISEPIAVATSLPKGTVLWRSPEYVMQVTCWQNLVAAGERVWFYLSPGDPSQSALGKDLEMGVRLDNGSGIQDYDSGTMQQGAGYYRVPLSTALFNFSENKICQNNESSWAGISGCPSKAQTATLRFSVFLRKKSAPSAGKDGNMTAIASMPVFQLDGSGGLNGTPGRNFRINITNLDQLRYVACESRLGNMSVDFGSVAPHGAVQGAQVRERPFTVTATKDCDSRYGLNAQLAVVSGTLDPDRVTLVPSDNPSVGIRLFKEGSATPLEFNKRFRLVELTEQRVSTQDFLARLYWRTSTPTLGAFNAAALFEVYYF